MKNGLTIKDATERWVHEMNAIPTGMIEKMMEADMDDWREVTLPSVGDQVYADSYGLGEVAEVISTEDGVVLVVDLDVPRSEQVEIPADEVEIERLELLPMLSKGYKKGKLGANTYWMDKNNNVIEEVIKEEF